ncbi:ABC transporter substrate-binding protein [Changpingibacter yushuensis]|uniref:ABC transporter substrate-binding protein n=1 Tax=Changpingibacter yushuensis TaxID=2758440 RepID=UPI0015F5183D|nr:ABC transporter substrate-binding protein [Changpingibacter yushuensis]
MRSIRKRYAAAFAAVALLLTGCSAQADTSSSDSSAESSSEPISGQTITWAIETSPTTLNPQKNSQDGFVFIARNYADSYLYLDENGDYQPWLAEGYTLSDDQLTVTLNLRQGVTFSDGEAFNADAVIANFDYLTSDENSSTPRWTGILESYEKTDDYTVVFHLNAISPLFLESLSAVTTAPVSPKSLEKTDSLETGGPDLAFVGAYTVSSYTEGSELVLEKNDNYDWSDWGPSALVEANPGAPYAQTQVFRILPEASTRTGALTSSQVDVVYGVPSQDISLFDDDDTYTYGQVLNSGTVYSLYFNTTKAPFEDIHVRQALQQGVDYAAVVDSVYYGTGTQATQWFSPSSIFYDDDFTSNVAFDADAANALLDKAGWTSRDSDGYRTNAAGDRLTIALNADAPYIRDSRDVLFQAIAAELQENLGVELDFQALDPGTVTTLWEDNKNDAFDNSMGSSDISSSLDLLLTPWNPQRIFINEDAKAADLVKQAKEAPTKEERKALYDQVQDYVVNEQAYILPLYVPRDNWAASAAIQGINVSEISGHIFSTVAVWRAE